MPVLGIIGGSGYASWGRPEQLGTLQTPYGEPSSRIGIYRQHDSQIIFIARHGNPHRIPPHQVNYQANIWALAHYQADHVLSLNAVGGISSAMAPGCLVVPDQLVDYTWGRRHTFQDAEGEAVRHVEFANPYHGPLRRALVGAASRAGIGIIDGGTYGATQGPRLETAAEIQRMQNEGCDLVGMTGMPEAALARELALDYASICIITNRAASLLDQPVSTKEIEMRLVKSRPMVESLIGALQLN